jgi:tetratricopeptide (TPR) repeat protein
MELLATENTSERIFLIVSGSYGEYLIPRIKDHPSIVFIYIFCLNSTYHKQWTHSYSNIRDVFTDKNILIDRLANDIRLYTSNIPPFSIFNLNNEEKSMRDLTKENAKFMWYQLLIDILLRMPNNDKTNAKQEMINECCLHYEKNKQQMALINEFNKTYLSSDAVKWYTRDCFLFRLLNKAFRTENIDIIYKFRFFIIDLYQQLKQIHSDYIEYMGLDEIITLYRGQQLSPDELNKFKDNIGRLISMNTFLSTSLNQSAAKIFAGNGSDRPERESVLFEISIDPNKVKHPFGRIDHVSYMNDEKEILFSMATIFRIESVTEMFNDNEHIWCVRLITFNQDDDDVDALLNFYKRDIDKTDPLIIWAIYLSYMGEYSKSEHYYKIAAELITNNDDKVLGTIYNNIGITYLYRNQLDTAFEYYMLGLDLKQKKLISLHDQSTISIDDHLSIASSYQNIAYLFHLSEHYQPALENYEFSLNIKRHFLEPCSLTIAITLTNIGMLYNDMKDHLKALEYYEEALDIYEKTLPNKHPEKATLYESVGYVYYSQKKYPEANKYYDKAFEMKLKTLPAKHQSFATTYQAFAKLYLDKNDLDNALKNFLTAIDISKLYFDSFHLRISDMYNSVGFIYSRKGDLPKALEYYHLALQMNKQRLPADDPENVHIYNNIGMIYFKQSKYSEAIELYHKSLDIQLNATALLRDHRTLVFSFINLASAYFENKQNSEALDYFQEALAIGEKTFHSEHALIKTIHNKMNIIKSTCDNAPMTESTTMPISQGQDQSPHRYSIYS